MYSRLMVEIDKNAIEEIDRRRAGESFERLVKIIDRLRSPGGCPWDLEQTHETLKPMMIEEAYEAVEAIDSKDDEELAGELGDLLLQGIFHSRIADEEKRFSVADVIDQVTDKMVRRHPHVFGGDKAETSNDVLRSWEAIKSAEMAKKGKGHESGGSMLDSIPHSFPAVMESFQMTTKVSRVGFDWPDAASVLDKLDEELAEVKEAISGSEPNHQRVSEEIGDLLFTVVNLGRKLGVDAESALKSTNRKFRRRFNYIEEQLRKDGRRPSDADLAELDRLWEKAKSEV
ncbi:MAG TPA: nucleoside triphosphate pyrophosphohydrolase [Blastocatellia bacterium]|nr:nucleoside triphosphate pyrophosphohydrolase [Blastocatellia bacterium]